MKRSLLVLLCLFLPSLLHAENLQLAWINPWIAGAVTSGATKTCPTDETALISNINDEDDYLGVGNDSNSGFFGQKWTPASSGHICSATFDVRTCTGSGATYKVQVYAMSGTSLGSLVSGTATSSNQVISSAGNYKFTGLDVTYSASTEIAVVVTSDDADADNYCQFWIGTTDVVSGEACLWTTSKGEYWCPTADASIIIHGFTN